ncbi:MAG: putative membrane protein [Candidatus Woesebacteria bacterium GW2011_GWA2_40_7b]|uniref:Putative membrane protein n=1 Tax=Candidatus Woesebacteria bacterium GW2011_GWA2_40_7b TaxID=1618563 RepID=A0A0G0W7G1_9BACT|nr:MAG: putative membrane protein [Candidatus Woesebacteria bacterium GW2011_GWA2_40_7b]
MRAIFKHFIIDTVSLYLISQSITGLVFENGLYTLLLTGLVLMLTTMVIRPIINLLLLPINLVTFGLFKWVAYAISFYLVTLLVPGFKLLDFLFKGYSSNLFSIPVISLDGTLAFLAFAFLISFISSLMYWIFK